MQLPDIIFGAFIGLVLLPVIYDAGLYLVMKSEFLIWHALRSFAIVGMAFSAMNAPLPGMFDGDAVRRIVQLLATDFSIAVSGPFLVAYIERDKLSPWLGQALRLCLPAVVIGTILRLGVGTDPIVDYLRNLIFLGVLVLLIWGLGQALRRGSRAARYQAAAWSAVFGVCAYALFFELVLLRGMQNWMESILAAIAVEIVFTAIGVTDRFLLLKRERDEARTRERDATAAAITDPLTGLPNRRGLSQRLSDQSLAQPQAVALIDLDHFKAINDGYGHDLGDAALAATARALQGAGRFAARMGGEEFALLLYGADWREQAEEARRVVADYVAMDVPEIDRRVTASMGVCPIESEDEFAALLKTADQALYRAKRDGRNRMSVSVSSAPTTAAAA